MAATEWKNDGHLDGYSKTPSISFLFRGLLMMKYNRVIDIFAYSFLMGFCLMDLEY